MKILLINVPYETSYSKVRSAMGKFPPMNLAYLASFLRKSNNVNILDAANIGIKIEDILSHIPMNVDIVGISLLTPMFKRAKELLKTIKEARPNCHTVVGGPHVSALPNETLERNQYIDFGIVGEGELPFLKLVESLESKTSFEGINGLVYRKHGEIKANTTREYIPCL
jgi:radical SAM superfamily enzyme YgiQ (UPF0313 family)